MAMSYIAYSDTIRKAHICLRIFRPDENHRKMLLNIVRTRRRHKRWDAALKLANPHVVVGSHLNRARGRAGHVRKYILINSVGSYVCRHAANPTRIEEGERLTDLHLECGHGLPVRSIERVVVSILRVFISCSLSLSMMQAPPCSTFIRNHSLRM